MPKHRNKQHWNDRNPGFQRNNRQSAQNFQRNMSQDFYNGYCNQTNYPPNASYYNVNLDFQNNYSQNYSNNYYDPSYQRNFTQSHIQSNFNQKHEMNFIQNATNTELNQNFQRRSRESSSSSINDTIDQSDFRQNDRTKNVKKKSAKTNPWYKKQQTNQKTNQQTNQQTNQKTNQQTNQQINQKTNIKTKAPPAQGYKRKQKRNVVAEYYKITENFTENGYIIKETLYQDPSLFYANVNSNTDLPSNNDANDNNWTDAFWQKHDVSGVLERSKTAQRTGNVSRKNQNRLERSLNAMLSKPVEMSKGKSLLQKMGWQGGGLGRDGDGIVEPIAPKATYAVNTIGLGHGTENPKQPIPFASMTNKTLQRRPEFQNNFCMNVLLYILEFVKNDEENKIVFEPRLSKLERKKIHQIVEKIRESDNLEDFENFEKFSEKHLEVVTDIWVHNCYELWTESEGETKTRRLCLFKEAPAHVYLVTPEDLTENDESNDENEIFCEEIIPKMESNDQIVIISDGSDSENEVTTNNDKSKEIKEENQQSVVKNENMSEEANICNDIVVKMEINENISDTTTNTNIHDAVKPKLENDEETCDIAVKMEINENISDTTTNINIHDVVKPKLENDEETCDIAVKMEINDQNTKNEEIVSKKATNIDNNDDVPKLESDNCLENLLLNDKMDQKNTKESVLAKIVEYFKEFSSDETFKEFRFLGPFNSEEIMHINMFFDICMKQDDIECDEKHELLAAFDNDSVKFNVLEDNNGKAFIKKVGDSPELPSEDEDIVYASGVYI